MVRLRCDIGDFHPEGVPAIRDSAAGWVAMGKHLCGGATDLMLRCCVLNSAAGDEGAPAYMPALVFAHKPILLPAYPSAYPNPDG